MSVENDLINTTIMQDVHILLKDYSRLRDSDRMLWLAYCVKHKNLKQVLGVENYEKFKKWLLDENIPAFESITRARRKVQENFADVRGSKYKEKQASAEVIRDHFSTFS